MLTIDKLAFSWQDNPVLKNVSFSMARNEIVALLGPNGSGKTTLIRCILGQLKPGRGEVSAQYDGAVSGDRTAPLISWVPQRVTCYPLLSVKQNLTEFARMMGIPRPEIRERVADVLSLIGLEHRANDQARTLSGGMQRMLNVGIGLVSKPDILLIDEPTAGIDQVAHERLYQVLATLKSSGLSILMTTHDLEDVSRLATRVLVLAEGELRADGTVDELILQRFADKREVDLELLGDSADNASLETELASLGLEHTGEGIWSGLVNMHGDELRSLYGIIDAHEPVIGRFRQQKPNMERFIRSMLEERETSQ